MGAARSSASWRRLRLVRGPPPWPREPRSPPRPPPAARTRGGGLGAAPQGRRAPVGRLRRRSQRRGQAHRAGPAPSRSLPRTRAAARATAPPAAAGAPQPAPGCPPPAAGVLRGAPGAASGTHARPPGTQLRRRGRRGAQQPEVPGDPRRAVPWSFIHKKGPTTLLGLQTEASHWSGRRDVTERGLSTGRYPVTP